MLGPEKVLEAIQVQWTASLMTNSVPGGLWHDRIPPEVTASPAAVVTIEDLEFQHTSGPTLERYQVTITIWSKGTTVAAGAMRKALGEAFPRAASTLTFTGATLVDWLPTPGKFEVNETRLTDGNVLAGKASWEATIQVS